MTGGLGSAPAVFAAVAAAGRKGADELAAVAAVSDLRGGRGNGRGRHVVRKRPDGSDSREVVYRQRGLKTGVFGAEVEFGVEDFFAGAVADGGFGDLVVDAGTEDHSAKARMGFSKTRTRSPDLYWTRLAMGELLAGE